MRTYAHGVITCTSVRVGHKEVIRMNEDKTEKTYKIRKQIIEYLDRRWEGEQPVVTVHEGKIGRDRMVHVSIAVISAMALDKYKKITNK